MSNRICYQVSKTEMEFHMIDNIRGIAYVYSCWATKCHDYVPVNHHHPPTHPPDGLLEICEQHLFMVWKYIKRCLEGLESGCMVSGRSLEGVWKVIGTFLDGVLGVSRSTWNLTRIEYFQVLSCKLGHKKAWLWLCAFRPPTHPSTHHLICYRSGNNSLLWYGNVLRSKGKFKLGTRVWPCSVLLVSKLVDEKSTCEAPFWVSLQKYEASLFLIGKVLVSY